MCHYHIYHMFHYSLLFFCMKTDQKKRQKIISNSDYLSYVIGKNRFLFWTSITLFHPIVSISNVSQRCDHFIYICKEKLGEHFYGSSLSGNIPKSLLDLIRHCLNFPVLQPHPSFMNFLFSLKHLKNAGFFFLFNC